MTIRNFLTQHDLAVYVDAFEAQHVGLGDVPDMTDDELITVFGMKSYGDRKRFKAAVAGLSGAPAPSLSGPTRMEPTPTPAPSLSGPTRMDTTSAFPERLGNYRVLGFVGTGGMGTVVRARHTEEGWARQQGGDVAIKLIHPHIATDPGFRSRFMAEAAMGRKVQHRGFVTTWDVLSEGAWLGTVMSLVVGEPLTNKVVPGGLPVADVVRLLTPIAEALDYLHGLGIVHRDLKPANIVVRPDGQPVVLDLGIAKDTQALENHTRTMTAMGTSAWMAPEQADAKNVDGAADRYALGMIAYVLLAGRLPWEEGTSEMRVLANKLNGQLASLAQVRSGLPGHVTAAVMKMVSVDAGARYATCGAFVGALQQTGPQRVTHSHAGVSFDMAVIPPCTFTMGSPVSEPGRDADETQHAVRLTRGFAMGTTPVTQALWTAVMGSNPSHFTSGSEAPQRPVEQVSWFDSVRFCNALSAKLGLRSAYAIGNGDEPEVTCDFTAPGFRLPTEAEWECAARAGTAHRYAGSDDLANVGWFGDNSGSTTHAVAQKKANAWGLYDMSGNVWEWTSDLYGDYAGNATDPVGAASGPDRVYRGGSWGNAAVSARAADRSRNIPGIRYINLGFRLSRTIP
jgi:formylglycine-generating enzyme required for sulfatase activity